MTNVSVALKEEAATTGQSSEREKRRRYFEIVVFDRWCKGCGLCSAFCPTQAIMCDEDDRPKIVLPERCTGCQWCVMHCPDLAIRIRTLNPERER
jgi:2-oxoglutarate ferredoxin oxidoreductase subunit delta